MHSVYDEKSPPLPRGGGEISGDDTWGKNMKRGKLVKEENVKEKRGKTKHKGEIEVKRLKVQ
jgi:hypothetical protein